LAGKYRQAGYKDGKGSKARFDTIRGLAIDQAGNLYAGDSKNYVFRKIIPDGTVTTLAGKPGVEGNGYGPLGTAAFGHISGLAIDNAGNLYVSDSKNQVIKKIVLE
jgi:hypothetical protein